MDVTNLNEQPSGIKGYNVYRDGIVVAYSTITTAIDGGLAPNSVAWYHVTSVDNAGNESAWSAGFPLGTPACPDGAPPVPRGLTLLIGNGNATLQWSGTAGVLYQAESAPSPSGPWIPVDVPTLSFAVTNILGTSGKVFRVGLFTNTPAYVANYQVNRNDLNPPPAPTLLSLTALSNFRVLLSWAATADAGTTDTYGNVFTSGLDRYLIYRDGVFLKSESNGITTSLDATLSSAGQHTYSIAAIDRAGNVSGKSSGLINLCTYSLSPVSYDFASRSQTGSFSVNAAPGCSWTASTAYGWIHTSSSGSGNGTVSYSVDQNGSTVARSGTITVGGQSFVVNQMASPCSYTLSPSTNSLASGSASGSFVVSAATACSWVVTVTNDWIHSGGSGTGNGTVNYTVDANTGVGGRSGVINVGGALLSITQTGSGCNYSLSPGSTEVGAGATSGAFTMIASAGCIWTAASMNPWLHATNSGLGLGTVTYSVDANQSTSSRSGVITVAGRTFTINQGPASVANTNTPPGQAQWVSAMLGSGTSKELLGVSADHSGNVVVIGDFQGTIDFGGGAVNSAGGYDGFVTKYSQQGNLLWSKRLGDVGDDSARAVAIDSQDNIIVVGSFMTNVDFGGTTLASRPDPFGRVWSDIFVARYNPSGTLMWAKRFGGTAPDTGDAVAIDASDNIFVASRLNSMNADFGGFNLSTAGNIDVALTKLNSSGAVLWAKRFGGADGDWAHGLAVDRSGDVIVTGEFWSTTDLGGGSRTSSGASDIFVARYSGADGSYRWGRNFGAGGVDRGYGVAVDPRNGNVIVTGGFGGSVDFGGGAVSGGIFLAGYDSSGNHLWSRGYGTSSTVDSGLAVSMDGNGNLAFGGAAYSGAVDFGGGWLIGNGNADLFVASFTVSGNAAPVYRWARRAGTGMNGVSQANAVGLDSLGHVFLAGTFQMTVDFGGVSSTAPPATAAGFVTQYSR